MTDTNQLPPLPTLRPGDSHMESLIEAAIQGHASTREAMRWLVRQIVPQPAQAMQAGVTDDIRPEDFTVEVVVTPMGGFAPVNTQGVRVTHKPTGISVTCDVARSQHTNRHQAFEKLRAILALRPTQVNTLAGCNCRWDGDNQVEWCELHLAHKEAIHEWAERAKSAEQKLALRPEQVPMTDERSVSVKVDRELFSFHSEQDWVNKARSRYANCGVQKGHYITVDAAGHVMHMGLCFKHAAYPVTVYQLQTNWPKEQA